MTDRTLMLAAYVAAYSVPILGVVFACVIGGKMIGLIFPMLAVLFALGVVSKWFKE